MSLSRSVLIFFAVVGAVGTTHAQYGGPRLFLDAPSFFVTAPDAPKIAEQVGLGTEATLNIANHNGVIRLGGGSNFTLNPKASGDEMLNSFLTTPFVKAELGAGRYRSNGNKCAKTHRPAFTMMAKGGIRYDFYTPKNRPDGTPKGDLDYTVGVEFGYFYIRDIIRNTEVFGSANYFVNSKNIAAEFGFRTFFNLRGRRD
jgi:hypothetical protein